MEQALARGDQEAADQAFRKVIAADDRPGDAHRYPVGWQENGSANGSSSSSPPSDPNNVDQLGKTQAQDLVMGATCPVPCASPLATSQAGLGNMTQLLGKH